MSAPEIIAAVSIRTISSREVYRNRWMTVREDSIERSNGQPGIYGLIVKLPSCIVIPIEHIAEGDFVWLVRQYRYTVNGTFFEFPQGSWEEIENVDALDLAVGELREETGLRANQMTHITSLWIAYGAMQQVQHVFLAEGLTQGTTERDAEEHDMTVHRVPVSELEDMLLDGRIMDNCTAAAWGSYRIWRERQTETKES